MKWPGLATMIGLVVALAGPPILAGPAGGVLGDPGRLSTHIKGQMAMWTLLALIAGIVIVGEHRSLDSIGLHAPTWGTLGWGGAAAALIVGTGTLIFPFLMKIGALDLNKGLSMVENWPLWLRFLASLTAGVVEEALYRGYAIERLAWMTGNYWWAAGIAVVVFGLAHMPLWGRGLVFWSIFAGSVFTVLYVWRHDLLACMIAHSLCDLKGLVIDLIPHHRRPLRSDSANGELLY